MLRKSFFTALCTLFVTISIAQPTVNIVSFATGFNGGISDIACAGDSRLFIVQQLGYISIVDSNGNVNPGKFLDIHNKVTPTTYTLGDEQGLLGLAFSPDYANDGFFYINYTNKTGVGNTIIARYHVSSNPDSADVASEEILFNIQQPYSNHNGGSLKFGSDGFLYCGLGDGGLFGDPGNRAQNTDSLLGKILRIDVSSAPGYTIPPTNPFVSGGGAPEIWAFGVRNPWRFSFDRLTNDLWIGDVGQDMWEEIDFQSAGASGGTNYGWRCYEGFVPYNTTGCTGISYVDPVYTYSHSSANGCSITGGYVYRGAAYPDLQGYYFFADFCSGKISALSPTYTANIAGSFSGKYFVTFGENNDGELFVGSQSNGTIYRIVSTLTGMQELTDEIKNVSLYPTPNNGDFTCDVDAKSGSKTEIIITDLTGRVYYSTANNLTPGNNRFVFNLDDAAAGVYFLKIITETGCINRRFEVMSR